MATPFTEIYNLNEVIKLDSRLFNKPKNLVYQLYYNYLIFSITYFRDDCYKNLENFIPFSQTEYEFTNKGTSNLKLNPTPPDNCLFYVSLNDIEIDDFTYDTSTNQITINNIPSDIDTSQDTDVYVSAYIIGQFNEDLNLTEKMILSEGMNIPYLEAQKNKQELLNQMVYGSDFRVNSQAEHLKQLNSTWENQYYTVRSMINAYTFKQNPKGLIGLGGGLK